MALAQPPASATEKHSVGFGALKGALLMGSALGGGTYLLSRYGNLGFGPMTNRMATIQGAFGALLGMGSGMGAAIMHNRTAEMIGEFQALDASGQLVPQNLPPIPPTMTKHTNTLVSTITAGAFGALLWGGLSAFMESAMTGRSFSLSNMNRQRFLSNAALGFLFDAPGGYVSAVAKNERADAIGFFTRRAEQNAKNRKPEEIVAAGPASSHQMALATLLASSDQGR